MKTTLDLPDDLVREVKLRAVHENRRIKDVVADALRRGLAVPDLGAITERRVRLPLVHCVRHAAEGDELTPDAVAELLVDQETEWHAR